MRTKVSYANVVATLALFLSLGGGAYAAVTITGRNVANGSLTGKDVRNESIRSADVRGLRITDFAPGQLPAGPKGDKGDRGERGEAGSSAPSGPGARVQMTSRQSFPNALVTTVALDDVEFDTNRAFEADRLVAPRAGVYVINGGLNWSIAAAATGVRGVWIEVNGLVRGATRDAATTQSVSQNVTVVDRLAPGDVLTLRAYQNTGAGVSSVATIGAGHAYLSFQWLGP